MDKIAATKAMAALAQESRLDAFRLLVKAGDTGLPAGEIARVLGIPHNTLSSHLAILVGAGLALSRREGRSIIYRADFDGIRSLMGYLLEDCCQGRPELCAPVLDSIDPSCCAPTSKGSRNETPAH